MDLAISRSSPQQAGRPTTDGFELYQDIPHEDRARLAEKNLRQFSDAAIASDAWRRRALRALRYLGGEQWALDVIEYLDSQERPHLVINRLLAPILFVLGLQRQQRQEPTLIPEEPGDARNVELMQELYKWHGKKSREPVIDSLCFADVVSTGLCYWKPGLDFSIYPEGCPSWDRVGPLSVFPDPNWLEGGWSKIEFCFHALWMTVEEGIRAYPQYEDDIRGRVGPWLNTASRGGRQRVYSLNDERYAGDPFSDERMWWDRETQRVRILECWRRTLVDVEIGMFRGQVIDDPEELQRIAADPGGAPDLQRIPRAVPQIRVQHQLQELLFDDIETPYPESPNTIPIFPAIGYYFFERPFGMPDPALDAQDEANRLRSTMLEISSKTSQSGWMNKRDGGAITKELEEQVAGVGVVVNYDTHAPTQIEPPEMPQNLVLLEGRNSAEIGQLINVNDENLGMTTQKTISGKAIEARQRGGLVPHSLISDNFILGKTEAVKFMVTLIKTHTTPARALRILATTAAQQQGPNASPLLQQVADGTVQLTDVLALLNGAFSAEYDVEIAMKPWEPSLRMQAWQTLLDIVEQFGPGSLPPSVLLTAAKDAGLLTEAQVKEVLAFQQQQQQVAQAPPPNADANNSGGMEPLKVSLSLKGEDLAAHPELAQLLLRSAANGPSAPQPPAGAPPPGAPTP